MRHRSEIIFSLFILLSIQSQQLFAFDGIVGARAVSGIGAELLVAEASPESIDELFGLDESDESSADSAGSISADQEFGLDDLQVKPASQWQGFVQNEMAYTKPSPGHWSKMRNTLELGKRGKWESGIGWKLSGRLTYDAVFDVEDDIYPAAVREDQRFEATLRETYIDISAGDWDFRLGRQHIVWGEMVGLFFADVVSAKDLREFILPDFDLLRIPQWAARAEYFAGDFHAEAILIPVMTYDEIGKPGAEFYPGLFPAPPGFAMTVDNEETPADSLSNMGYGLRVSYLHDGWDGSLFYYSSMDTEAAFFRTVATTPVPMIRYQPRHERTHKIGATMAKDLGFSVLKGEAVYTLDRWFSINDFTDADGVVEQDVLDYIVGLEFSYPQETRLNLQFFQRRFPDHDARMIPDNSESGVSVLLSTQAIASTIESELLLIRSLNRSDWSAQAKLTWEFKEDWRLVGGVDVFDGPATGLFGQYDDNDRVYTEIRYSF